MSYVTNPQVIHETIDGETIIIDLATGTYFSLRGSAPAIWNVLVQGASAERVVEELRSRYEAGPGEIEDAAGDFLAQLEREQLIAASPNGAGAAPVTESRSDRAAFEAPRLEKFEDMQDIILLDPVHNVDDRGWPHAAPVSG